MIKLFWNTHNQKKTINNNKKEAVDYKWGVYHKKNSDVWIYEILKKINYDIIETEKKLEKGDTLIIVDSSIESLKPLSAIKNPPLHSKATLTKS